MVPQNALSLCQIRLNRPPVGAPVLRTSIAAEPGEPEETRPDFTARVKGPVVLKTSARIATCLGAPTSLLRAVSAWKGCPSLANTTLILSNTFVLDGSHPLIFCII